MSGTSIDGVDAVACKIEKRRQKISVKFLAHAKILYPKALRADLHEMSEGGGDVDMVCRLGVRVGKVFGRAARKVMADKNLKGKKIALIGSHGQTICHAPEKRATLQIGGGAIIAAITGVTTWTDFRSADLASGGVGAPLAPVIHLPLFGDRSKDVAVVNIGGIANLTYIKAGAKTLAGVIAFDTGPGNTLIDYGARRLGASGGYDKGGKIAASGALDERLLKRFLAHPYFKRRPPKSTGRELFGINILSLAGVDKASYQWDSDTMATVTELTARSVMNDINRLHKKGRELRIVICGGGAKNGYLMNRIRMLAGTAIAVVTSDEVGAPVQMVEGGLMALLAYYGENNIRPDLSAITGAARPAVLGARYPA